MPSTLSHHEVIDIDLTGRAAEQDADVRAPGRQEPSPAALAARERQEIDALARRLQERHPQHQLDDLTALVAQTYAGLAGSRVQTYRLILTERAVRRRLATRSEAGTGTAALADAG